MTWRTWEGNEQEGSGEKLRGGSSPPSISPRLTALLSHVGSLHLEISLAREGGAEGELRQPPRYLLLSRPEEADLRCQITIAPAHSEERQPSPIAMGENVVSAHAPCSSIVPHALTE